MSTNSNTIRRTPPGILLIRNIRGKDWSLKSYRYIILLLTFIAYATYHASRKPSSIVKSVLYPESMKSSDPPWPVGNVFIEEEFSGFGTNGVNNKGWYPFNGTDGTSKLGEIDVAFLACYSSGMYVAGHLGDTLDLRLFLTIGMIGSGIFVGLFGMGYYWNIHEFWFYLFMQMVAGLFQATGWPSVVAVIGNWFGKRKRGLIMGIWNAHTSVGNISGSLLAAAVLDYGWGWSFIVPGALIASAGVLVYLFLPAYPEDIGFSGANASSSEEEDRIQKASEQKGSAVNVEKSSDLKAGSGSRKGIGIFEACSIPGVIPFALCLFFSKLVAYTFLYWLPFYLSQTEIGGEYMSVKSAGNLSTLFDVGGIVGGVLAGYISDKLIARATTAATFMFAAIPSMILYRLYGNISRATNILLMMIAGLFVNGPYALITTAVSADLGTHSSLRGDSRALATVTAIIDGTGSVGAALGPLITGFLSSKGWDTVFMMLNAGALIASLLLSHLVIAEFRERTSKPLPPSHGQQNHEATGSQPLLGNQR
ncbi:putative glycerol-3-phosphate transporter 4 isoform X1 [Hibiscus syriacus]|uniref:putative glycerol-3-phosphate transporter 4 isoform X1 n=1 Tax=Hibiscus syriacus TaxID=106335 RepID=UPI0019229BF2|nr:putative glycerol-3-phosphate transporter 4 isoform X1 [Hibiscus syriacus]XP_039022581.1 putative glycerol-3-phosphate transporter 4 isoform X1 [Hibiscus syriacus]XP_039022582.1 putative glycerol-3-phosphate transporter 4 isoform X1 [Hibiscus syriacus]